MKIFSLKTAFFFMLIISAGFICGGIKNSMAQPDGKGAPPPEAEAACEGLNMGEVCSFDSPKGDLILGTCEHTKSGVMACVPPPGGPGGDRPPRPE